MAETYSVEAFLKADHTGFVRGFQVAAQAARDFQRDISNMDTSGIENAGKQFEKVGDKMQTQGKKIMRTGGMLTAGLTLPIIGAAVAAVNTGMEFEKSMSNVQAISGATGDDLASLEKKAREMGAGTSKSAGEAADAMSYMALAGWDTTQIMGGIEPVLRLSEAGNLDLARASDLVTDSMSALGIEVKDLPGYLDQVAQTSRKANTDIDALMEANLAVGGSFNNLNVPLAEGNALLGIMANRGIKGAEAGNALSSILVNMTSGAGQAGKAMEELGINAFDSEGKFKGVENVLKEVSDATEGLTEEQQTQYLSMIAGKTQLSGFQALLDGLGKEYGELKGDIEGSNGALNDMAATMQDNLKGKLTEIGSALSEVGIKIYQSLLPYLDKAATFFLNLVNKVNAMSPAMQMVAAAFAIFLAAIGPVITFIGFLVVAVGMVVSNFGILLQRFAPLIARQAALKAGLSLLGRAFAALLGPVGIAIAVLMTIIPIFVKLYKENEKFRAVVDTVWTFIKDAISAAVAFISGIVQSVIGALVSWWNANQQSFVDKAMAVWNAISSLIGVAISYIRDTIQLIASQIQAFWSKHGEFISAVAEKVWSFISNTVVMHAKNIWAIISSVLRQIQAIFQMVWPIISGVVQVAFAIIKTIVQTAIKYVFGIINTTMSLLKGDWKGAWTTIKNTAKSILDGIVNTFKGINLREIGRNIIQGLINGIKSMVSNAVRTVSDLAGNVIGAAKGIFGIRSPSRVFAGFGEYISEGLANGIDDKARTAVNTVGDLARSVTNAFNPNLAIDGMDYSGQIRNMNGQMKRSMSNHVTAEMSVQKQPVIVNIYDNKEAVRAYVNEENAIDATIRRF